MHATFRLLIMVLGLVSTSYVFAHQPQFLDITKYGADPSGKKDSAVAIQSAINDAFDGGVGHKVFIPTGSYLVSTAINLHRNVGLIGNGNGFNSVIRFKGNAGLRLDGSTQKGGHIFRNELRGFTLDMRQADEDAIAIDIKSSYSVLIRNLFIYESKAWGIKLLDSRHIGIYDVSIYGSGTGKGRGLENSGSAINIYNIDIENVANPLVIHQSANSRYQGKTNIFGAYIERFGATAIMIDGSSNNLIHGAYVHFSNASKQAVRLKNSPGSCACNNRFVAPSFVNLGDKHKEWPVSGDQPLMNNQFDLPVSRMNVIAP